jgi:hypothetical protein
MTLSPGLPKGRAYFFGHPHPWPLAVGELDARTPWFDVELRCCQRV